MYVNRASSNSVVFERANQFANPRQVDGKNIKPFARYLQHSQNKLLAHIVRAPINDPLRQCTLEANTIYPYDLTNRRVGRPRHNWTWKTYEALAIDNSNATAYTFKYYPKHYIDQIHPSIANRTIRT